jgi:hypothetical protein
MRSFANLMTETGTGDGLQYTWVFVDQPGNPHIHGLVKIYNRNGCKPDPAVIGAWHCEFFKREASRDNRFKQTWFAEPIWQLEDEEKKISYMTGETLPWLFIPEKKVSGRKPPQVEHREVPEPTWIGS